MNDATCRSLALDFEQQLKGLHGSYYVKLLAKLGENCPGLTFQAFAPGLDAGADLLIGNTELLFAVGAGADGRAQQLIQQSCSSNGTNCGPCAALPPLHPPTAPHLLMLPVRMAGRGPPRLGACSSPPAPCPKSCARSAHHRSKAFATM